MYAQFFGNYLLSRDILTTDQLIQAMHKKSSVRIKIGTLAIHAGYMTANEVDRVIILQTHQDKRFGEIAISEGYLTEMQCAELLSQQKPDFLLLGQVLVEDGIISTEELQDLIIDYQSEYELEDSESFSEETRNTIDGMIEKFFVLAERSLTQHEVFFFRLLLNNLVRFIGDDFILVAPSLCKEYPTNYCVSQKVNGTFSIYPYLDMSESACIEFASRYVCDTYTSFDEYVQASVEDFLNLHNGLFTVNMSNEFAIELTLSPPTVEEKDLIIFEDETYLLPVVYPFGTLHFILVLHKTH